MFEEVAGGLEEIVNDLGRGCFQSSGEVDCAGLPKFRWRRQEKGQSHPVERDIELLPWDDSLGRKEERNGSFIEHSHCCAGSFFGHLAQERDQLICLL